MQQTYKKKEMYSQIVVRRIGFSVSFTSEKNSPRIGTYHKFCKEIHIHEDPQGNSRSAVAAMSAKRFFNFDKAEANLGQLV